MNLEFPGAVPEIPVSDLKKAAAYYESNLGFSVDWGDEDGGIMGISKGQCRMFLTNSTFRAHYHNAGPVLVWLNLDSKEQVNELYGLWSASQAKIVSSPESKPWGLHEFTIADLDGNLFRIFYDFATADRESNAIELAVKGMTCANCELHIENEVKNLSGVSFVKASHEQGFVIVEFNEKKVDKEKIIATINSTGYKVEGNPSSALLQGKEKNCTASTCEIPTGDLPDEVNKELIVLKDVSQIQKSV